MKKLVIITLSIFFVSIAAFYNNASATEPKHVSQALKRLERVQESKPYGVHANKQSMAEWKHKQYKAEKEVYNAVINSDYYLNEVKEVGEWKDQIQYNYDDGKIVLFVQYYEEHDMYIVVHHK